MEIVGGLGWRTEMRLEQLARLVSSRYGGVTRSKAHAALVEVATTNPVWAPAWWKLVELLEDFDGDDAIEAFDAYDGAAWREAELFTLLPDDRRIVVAYDARFQSPDLAHRLLWTEKRLRHEQPDATLEVSELALRVAQVAAFGAGAHLRLLGGTGPRRGIRERELVLRCLASWTNAHRIVGDLGEARRLVDAIEWFRPGIGGKAEAEALWAEGAALIDLEEWNAADAALSAAVAAYQALDKPYEARCIGINRVRLLRASGATPRRYLGAALEVFDSFTEIDVLRDPTLFRAFQLNLPLYHVEAGEPIRARELWETIPRFESRPLEARRWGVGAIIDFELGKTGEAEAAYRFAVEQFQSLSMPYDAALFLLYLGRLLLTTGRFQECESTLIHASMLFRQCQLKRWVIEALDRLQEAITLENGLETAIRDAIRGASGIVRRRQ